MAKRRVRRETQEECGRRSSARRTAILEILGAAPGAMTVEQIHAAAARRVPGLGIATVYRNLRQMLDGGSLQVIILPDGQRRYEAAGKKHHHHFQCGVCGRAYCLDGCLLAEASLAIPNGFLVTDHELTLRGVCAACR